MTVVLSYDLGNGLTVERGEEHLAQWVPSSLRNLPLEPLEAVRFINRYARYLANLRAVQQPRNSQCRDRGARAPTSCCPPTARACSMAASPAWCATGD